MNKKKKCGMRILSLRLVFSMLLSGCGSTAKEENVTPLEEVNQIPEDGIITKAQFKEAVDSEKFTEVQFEGSTENGISYTWIYDLTKVHNPEDQNLLVDFNTEGLDDIKAQANDANDVLMLTFHGKGVITVPTLCVTVPGAWESDTVYLVKEQGDKLARISDVQITVNDKDGEEPTTTLMMTVNTLDGDCYVVGGVTNVQNKGAQNANGGATESDDSTNTSDNQNSGGNSNQTQQTNDT